MAKEREMLSNPENSNGQIETRPTDLSDDWPFLTFLCDRCESSTQALRACELSAEPQTLLTGAGHNKSVEVRNDYRTFVGSSPRHRSPPSAATAPSRAAREHLHGAPLDVSGQES
jgi:hypothetical protein